MKQPDHQSTEIAVFGGGCFWCTEALFVRLRGVQHVTSGYAGGTHPRPTYTLVSEELTGHAEVIRVEFDPAIISYQQLLTIFWHLHDPTTPNQQGADVGTQYRSIILATTQEQYETAEKTKQQIEDAHLYSQPIVTQIVMLDHFYPAEEYHQRYYDQHPDTQYCSLVINPKLEKLMQTYTDLVDPRYRFGSQV